MSLPVEVHEQSWPSRIGAGVGVGFAAGAGCSWGGGAAAADGLPAHRLCREPAGASQLWAVQQHSVAGAAAVPPSSPARPIALCLCAGALTGAVASNWGDIKASCLECWLLSVAAKLRKLSSGRCCVA